MGDGDYGIEPAVIRRIAEEVHQISASGVQVGLVIGGGNIFRGAGLAQGGMERVTGDHMGMLATVINSLAMQDALRSEERRVGKECRSPGKTRQPVPGNVCVKNKPGL